MAWTLKVAIQWALISALITIPFYAHSYWPYVNIFCWTMAFGIFSYGLANPAYALRRFIIASLTCTFSLYLLDINQFEIILNILKEEGNDGLFIKLFEFILRSFNNKNNYGYLIGIILIAMIFDISLTYKNNIFNLLDISNVSINRGELFSRIHISRSGNAFISKFSISNNSNVPIHITGAFLSLFFTKLQLSLYSNDPDEITGDNVLIINPNSFIELNATCHEIGGFLNKAANILRVSRLNYIFDLTGHIIFIGDSNFKSNRHEIIVKIY